jgi:hypothetical protein
MTNDEERLTAPRPTSADRYVFTGRIHPERYGWHVEPPLVFENELMHITLSLLRGQLIVEVVTEHEGPLVDLKNAVVDLAESAVNALGFAFAASLEVEVISCLDPTGAVQIFNTGFDDLRAHDGDLSEDEIRDFRSLATAAARDLGVRAAIADLTRAIRSPLDTLFYCYRATESIRQQYLAQDAQADAGAARKASWVAMREAAEIDEVELRWLEPFAASRRHGSLSAVTEQDRRRALQLARKVVLAHAHAVMGTP